MNERKDWKETLFTWLYRTFCYLIPGGFALWTLLIETLINKKISTFDKVSFSSIFILAVLLLIAIFFYGKHLRKKITCLTNQCIECTDDEMKIKLVNKKKKYEAKQEIFHNACFIAPFIILWFVISLIEKKVISLRGTLMVVSISMLTGFGFNGVAQWLKGARNVQNKK